MGPSTDDWPPGELTVRERVRALEVSQENTTLMARDRLDSASRRMDGIDGRLKEGDTRMHGFDRTIDDLRHAIEPLKPLPAQMADLQAAVSPLSSLTSEIAAMKAGWQRWRGRMYYGLAAGLSALLLSEQITAQQAGKLLLFMAKTLGGAPF